jgi:hypothetical protein
MQPSTCSQAHAAKHMQPSTCSQAHAAYTKRAIRAEHTMQRELRLTMERMHASALYMQVVAEMIPALRDLHTREIDILSRVPACWQVNADSLRRLLQPFSLTYGIADKPHSSPSLVDRRPVASYDSVSQLFHHLVRDYSSQGHRTR